MRISDSRLISVVVWGAMAAVPQTMAFELRDPGSPRSIAPSEMLSVAPPDRPGSALASPSRPGAETSVQDALKRFFHLYKSGEKQEALRQLEFAAGKGDVAAQWKLAKLYADGDGVQPNDAKAFRLFSSIANTRADESRDSPHAGVVAKSFVALGAYWLEGIPGAIQPNPARALEFFTYAASYFGDPDAQYHLARMYLNGIVGPADPMRAARWLNLASEKGHIYAQAVLGQMLFWGESMPRQASRGLMWLSLARDRADASKDSWIVELHEKALGRASDEERRQARAQVQRQQGRAVDRR
jgi:uncharacterized protein